VRASFEAVAAGLCGVVAKVGSAARDGWVCPQKRVGLPVVPVVLGTVEEETAMVSGELAPRGVRAGFVRVGAMMPSRGDGAVRW